MTDADLQYLKTATPAELMKLTNGIPWQRCAELKVMLTTDAVSREAVYAEWALWVAARAVHDRDVFAARSKQGRCDECGGPDDEKARRFTFTKEHGFKAHRLCLKCAEAAQRKILVSSFEVSTRKVTYAPKNQDMSLPPEVEGPLLSQMSAHGCDECSESPGVATLLIYMTLPAGTFGHVFLCPVCTQKWKEGKLLKVKLRNPGNVAWEIRNFAELGKQSGRAGAYVADVIGDTPWPVMSKLSGIPESEWLGWGFQPVDSDRWVDQHTHCDECGSAEGCAPHPLLTLNGKWGYRVLFLCARCREVINEFSPDWLIRSVPVDTAFYGNYVHWAHGKSMRVVK